MAVPESLEKKAQLEFVKNKAINFVKKNKLGQVQVKFKETGRVSPATEKNKTLTVAARNDKPSDPQSRQFWAHII